MNSFSSYRIILYSFFIFTFLNFSQSQQTLILPLKTQLISPVSPTKLPFHRNISLTVSLSVGTPPQNVTMVIDTGSELSWLRCNKTLLTTNSNNLSTSFDPTRSVSYKSVSCSSLTCTSRTRDFPIPASCDPNQLCHATLSYADASSSEGNLAADIFRVGFTNISNTVFGCMDSSYSTNVEEDAKSTGLMGMNLGSLSFVNQMASPKFSYCISGSDVPGILLFGESNFTWLASMKYTPLIQVSTRLPYFDRVAYTVQLQGIRVADKLLALPKSVFVPDHTGAGQTMIDSGCQFTFLLGPVYNVLRAEFLNQTLKILRILDEPNFVFQGSMDLCYRIALNQTILPTLPTVSLVFNGAEMGVSGDRLLYRVPGENRGTDAVHCFTFGNSELLGAEAYIIGHHHQQNVWVEFDLKNSRIGFAQVQCDLATKKIWYEDKFVM